MADFETDYLKVFGICHFASQTAERHPVTSQVVLAGLTHRMEIEGISEERQEEIFIEVGGALLVREAMELCDDR